MGESEVREMIGQFRGELIHINKGFDRLEQKIEHTYDIMNEKVATLSDNITQLNTLVKGENGLMKRMDTHANKTDKVFNMVNQQEAERKAAAKAEGRIGGLQGGGTIVLGGGALYGLLKGISYLITHLHF